MAIWQRYATSWGLNCPACFVFGACLNNDTYALLEKLRAIKLILYVERVCWCQEYQVTQSSQSRNTNHKLCKLPCGTISGLGRRGEDFVQAWEIF